MSVRPSFSFILIALRGSRAQHGRNDAILYLSTAADILGQLSQVTQNVPYIQMLAGMVVYISKANEV